MRTSHLPRLAGLLAGLALVAPATASAAEQFAGLTNDNHLAFFRSDSPGNLQASVEVGGLQSGEKLVGIGWLATAGRLYGLSSTNRVYLINPITGEATPLTSIPFTPPLNGTTFAFAVDPTTQVARSYSSTSQNLRINVVTGQVAGVDAAYAYNPGDASTGTAPAIAALAYSQPPVGGASAAALYGLDTATDALVTAPTQAAIVRTIGPLGVDATGAAGLAVVGGGAATPASGTTTTPTTTAGGGSTGTTPSGAPTAYASLSPGTGKSPRLYTVDLTTGAAKAVSDDDTLATIAPRVTAAASANAPVVGLAALGPAPDDQTEPRAVVAASSRPRAATLSKSGLPVTVSCDEACPKVTVTLKIASHTQKAVTGAILATAGTLKQTLKLDATSRKALRSDATRGLSLRVVATDAAGNQTTLTSSGSTLG
jgi:Domain of unknown function (DUF4394)